MLGLNRTYYYVLVISLTLLTTTYLCKGGINNNNNNELEWSKACCAMASSIANLASRAVELQFTHT